MLRPNCLNDGKYLVVTLSYDDGTKHDKRLVEIMNRYGVRGTFHLNSSRVASGAPDHVGADEIPEVYKGHEVSVHTVTHPHPSWISPEAMLVEMFEDRKALEKACGYPVRGMSYPFGDFNDKVIEQAKACGIVYSRTTRTRQDFQFPEDFLRWDATCHHRNNLMENTERFLSFKDERCKRPRLLYVWGHSYEFNDQNNWDLIEGFCEKVGNKPYVWYATNIEIYDYEQARQRLQFSADSSMVYNPSAISVWVEDNGTPVEVKPGELYREQGK